MALNTIRVMMEGQEIVLPPEVTEDDDTLKKALAPYYPEVANATISRSAKDGIQTIQIIKRAGTKGCDTCSKLGYQHWQSHELHTVEEWKEEVMRGETRCGYWEWVGQWLEAEADYAQIAALDSDRGTGEDQSDPGLLQ